MIGFAAERVMEIETMDKFTIFIESIANKDYRVVVRDEERKSVIRFDAFSKKHAHEIVLDLIDLIPKLRRQATVVFDAFVLPGPTVDDRCRVWSARMSTGVACHVETH
jgi:hypothetical protein